MKVIRTMVAALAVVCAAASARATTQVWYTSGADGAAGTTLNLSCDPTIPGNCTFAVVMNAANTVGLAGFATDLGTTSAAVSVGAPTYLGGVPFPSGSAAGVPGALQNLLVGTQGGNFTAAGAAPGSYQLVGFTLTYGGVQGSSADIFARNGAFEWATALGDYETVIYGPSPGVEGSAGNQGALPVIHITAVPEPTTLALLALGGLALIRRR